MYFEKDSQLEELLVRERVKDMTVTSRDDVETAMTEARWSRLVRELGQLEGWAAKLEDEFGPAARFAISHRLVEAETDGSADTAALIESLPPNGYELSVAEDLGEILRVRVVETETSTAQHVEVPAAMLGSSTYAAVQRAYAKVGEVVGLPPFTVAFGNKSAKAETFEQLRHGALDLAKEGMQISRFKGLGEMNPEQLWETTMDPAKRMLVRVEVEDAAAADRVFSTLMGDQVEPRRLFIEQNAKDVRFLDV
jgi:DNA gyrase subunit B